MRSRRVECEVQKAALVLPKHPGLDDDQIVIGIEAADLHVQRTKSIACARTRPVKK